MEKADVLDLERPIKWLNTVESRICHIFCQFHQNSTESQSSLFGHFEQSFGQNIVPKVRTINFFHNIVSQKNFQPKIQIWKKTDCIATYGHSRIKKNRMRATQKCLKVSKIWWYFMAIFLRVSCKFKPTVTWFLIVP